MINLQYNVPIQEKGFIDGDFMIEGTALRVTTTSNGHKFLREELKNSADSLTGVPLLIDHKNEVSAIKGRVLSGSFNDVMEKIDFKAKVMDQDIKQLIKDGRLNTVSVGASVSDIEEDEDGILIPHGIQFKELSLVAVPADSGATFGVALKEAYNGIKPIHTEKIQKEVKMSEEKQVTEAKEETKEDSKIESIVESKADSNQEMANTLKSIVETMKAMQSKLNSLEVKEEAEVEVEEPEAEEEAEESEESEVSEKFKIVQATGSIKGGSYTLVRNKY